MAFTYHEREAVLNIKNFPIDIIDLDTNNLKKSIKDLLSPVLRKHNMELEDDISFYDTDVFDKKNPPSYWISFVTLKNCIIYSRIIQNYYGDVQLKIQWDWNCDDNRESGDAIKDLEKCLIKILNMMIDSRRQASNLVLRRRLDEAAGRPFQAHPSNPFEKKVAEYAGLGMIGVKRRTRK